MLGKLIKHEWKSTRMIGGLLLTAMIFITFFGWLAFRTPMWNSMQSGGSRFGWLDIISIFTLIMYVMLLVGVNYAIIIFAAVHFYRTMYTDQGYLTHTLPVTNHQILGSKILVSSLWVMAILISTYLSVMILGASMVSVLLPEEYTLASLWREIAPRFGEILLTMGDELGLDTVRYMVVLLITSVLSPFITVTTLFGAISLGQLFSKHRVLMAILFYIGISVAQSSINSVIQSIVAVSSFSSFGNYISIATDSGFVISLLTAVALYFVSWHVNNNRLNME